MLAISSEQAWRSAAFERMQENVEALLGHPAVVAALDPLDLHDLKVTAGNAYLPDFKADGTARTPLAYRYQSEAVAVVPLTDEEFEDRERILSSFLYAEHLRPIDDTASPLGYDDDHPAEALFSTVDEEATADTFTAEAAVGAAAVIPLAVTMYAKHVDRDAGYVIHTQAAQVLRYSPDISDIELGKTGLHEYTHALHFLGDPVFGGELLLSRATSEGEAYSLEHTVDTALDTPPPPGSLAPTVHALYSRHVDGSSIKDPQTFVRKMIRLGAVCL